MFETEEKIANEGQQVALDSILDFLFVPNQKEMKLSGPAGTGKTFTMEKVISEVMAEYKKRCKERGDYPVYTSVVMAATTNKAADVLAASIGIPAGTIHSFLNLKVQEDYRTGRTYLKKTGSWTIHSGKLIIIDEASMIDSELYKALHEATIDCKILYVGDKSQLAPVMEELSPIYLKESPIVELTQQMRNDAQPHLMALCAQLRETVETGVFHPIKIVPNVIDLLTEEQLEKRIVRDMSAIRHESRILAYTNRRVHQYNTFIRDLRELPENYQEGEILVCNSPYMGKDKIPAETEVTVLKNHGTEMVKISGTEMYVDILDLEHSNQTARAVPFPVDQEHYKALIKYFAKEKDWPSYFELKNEYIDLRPRDAGTVHKAQGSTYGQVFIDLEDISTCTQKNMAARLLYVAVSRPKSRIFFYGNLANKYGGLIVPDGYTGPTD